MAHAPGDAHPYPIYGAHYLLPVPIFDADGDLQAGAAGLDSEVSKDLGNWADCTNEATEIQSQGIYYLYLTGAEMTAKMVMVQTKTTTVGAKTTPQALYPIRLPVLESGTAQAGAAGTITLASGASAKDSAYNGMFVLITNDSPAGAQYQARRIVSYVGSTKVATVDSNWGTNPSSASTYDLLIPEGFDVKAVLGVRMTDPTNAGVMNTDLAYWRGTQPNTLNNNLVQADVERWLNGVIPAVNVTGVPKVDIVDWLGSAPNALQSGRVDSYVGAIASGVIAALSFAAGALDAVWSTAARTLTAGTNIVLAKGTGVTGFNDPTAAAIADAVWDEATADHTAAGSTSKRLIDAATQASVDGLNDLSAAEVNAEVDTALADYDGPTHTELVAEIDDVQADIAALSIPTAAENADAVWDEATAGHTGAGSFGKRIGDNLDAAVSSRASQASVDALNDPSAGEIADAVWEEAIGDHSGVAGSTAEQLAAAGAAGDPWATAVPGAYGAGSAGKILGDNLNATVSSRASQASVDALNDISPAEVNAEVDSALADYDAPTKAELDTAQAAIQADVAALNDPTAGEVADAVLDEAMAGHTGAGSLGKLLNDNVNATISSRATPAQVATELGTYDAPTKAELDTAQAAIEAAIAALNDLTSAQVGDAVLDEVVDGTRTLRQLMRGIAAAQLGKVSGADTNNPVFRDIADSKDVIDAATDAAGNRTAVTLDLT